MTGRPLRLLTFLIGLAAPASAGVTTVPALEVPVVPTPVVAQLALDLSVLSPTGAVPTLASLPTPITPSVWSDLSLVTRGVTPLANPAASPAKERIVLERALLANDGSYARPSFSPDATAVLQYTGGTTGTPKGAMLSHANLTVNVGQVVAWQNRQSSASDRMLGILPFFGDDVFSSHEVERGKPAPDLFLHAARQMGVRPENCVVIEDSPFGVQGARAAGMTAIGYIGGSHLEEPHAEILLVAGAHYVEADWNAIGKHIGL